MIPTPLNSKYIKFVSTAIALIFLGTWVYSHVAAGIFHSLKFDGFMANGPFQLFNPLRRIAAGQTAGVDFQFFHGLGVPFLHYPLFALFGKTIYASELSRNFTTLFLFLSSLIVFAYVVTEHNLVYVLYFSVSAIVFLEILAFGQIDSYGLVIATPGNSLLGTRSVIPIFTFAILLAKINQYVKAMLVGLFFALSLFCGTEHGLALMLSFGLTIVLSAIIKITKKKKLSAPNQITFNVSCLLTAGAAFICAILILFGVFTKFSGIAAAIKYNLIEVPSDQFWYFGVPPNNYASSLLDFLALPWQGLLILTLTILLLIGFYISAFRSEIDAQSNFSFCTALMLFYGLISCVSCLGMLEGGYFIPLVRVFSLILLMWAYAYKDLLAERLISNTLMIKLPLLRIVGLILILIPFITLTIISYRRSPDIFTSNYFSFSPQLSKSWQNHFIRVDEAISRQFPESTKLTFWSTYSGLLEERNGFFLPKEDYIIHALGAEKRNQYLDSFEKEKPGLVQTIRRSYFNTYTNNHDYEQWLRNTTWNFYEVMLNNYELLVVTDRSLFWKRKSDTWESLSNNFVDIPFNPQKDTIEIPTTIEMKDVDFIVVKLRYSIHNPWKKLPLFGGVPRYLVHFENTSRDLPVSLPPYQTELNFPVMIIKGAIPKLLIQTHSLLPGAYVEIQGVAIRPYKLNEKQKIFLD